MNYEVVKNVQNCKKSTKNIKTNEYRNLDLIVKETLKIQKCKEL